MREYTFYNNKIKKTQNIKAESEEEAKKIFRNVLQLLETKC